MFMSTSKAHRTIQGQVREANIVSLARLAAYRYLFENHVQYTKCYYVHELTRYPHVVTGLCMYPGTPLGLGR